MHRGGTEERVGDGHLPLPTRVGQVFDGLWPFTLSRAVLVHEENPNTRGETGPRAVRGFERRGNSPRAGRDVGLRQTAFYEQKGTYRVAGPEDVCLRARGLGDEPIENPVLFVSSVSNTARTANGLGEHLVHRGVDDDLARSPFATRNERDKYRDEKNPLHAIASITVHWAFPAAPFPGSTRKARRRLSTLRR